jgi:DNA-binding XRE family transcriptional regulator
MIERVKIKTNEFNHVLAQKNISKSEFAKILKITNFHLSGCINGKYFPGPTLRRRMLTILNCAFDDVFYFEYVQSKKEETHE